MKYPHYQRFIHGRSLLLAARRSKLTLAELLSNEYGIIRKAGVDLLTSRHWGVHEADLLNLSEQRQAIVMDTLLSIPFQVEKILPFILQLKDSRYPKIKESLKWHCVQLIFSYEELIIDIISSNLDPQNENDKEIIENVTEVWAEYQKVLKQKREMLELNPFVNQRRLSELYYRQEQEYQTEQMEQAHKDNSFLRIGARNIPVLRGCAFKIEGENQNINKLGKVETKMYIDKKYYINPSAYELAFQNHVLRKNYIIKSDEGSNS